jgi:hypothetical protein
LLFPPAAIVTAEDGLALRPDPPVKLKVTTTPIAFALLAPSLTYTHPCNV